MENPQGVQNSLQWQSRTVNVAELIPFEKNPRKISADDFEHLKASLREDGYHQRIIATPDLRIIGGHQRIRALKELGFETIEVLVPDREISDEQFKRILVRDNLEYGAWELTPLGELLPMAELAEIGLPDATVAKIGRKLAAGLIDEDDSPEPPAQPVSAPGDVWLLGAHRVMCGDSTNAENVATLMAGDAADMIFTDPPYGMSYGGGRAVGKSDGTVKGFGVIEGDDKRGTELIQLVRDALIAAKARCKKNHAIYVCFPWRTYAEFTTALAAAGIVPRSCIVWDKKSIGLGSSKGYRPQHEFIFYAGGEWYGDKAQTDVWAMGRAPTSEYVHPTQKPVELVERALCNSTQPGGIVLDVFGGSGSTLIACEKAGNAARLMELDPKYVDVIVQRWQSFTGQQARLESTGEMYIDRKAA